MPRTASPSIRRSRSARPPLGSLARRIPAALLISHGVAHLVGAVAALTAARNAEPVAYFFDRANVSDRSLLWALGAGWIVVALGYAAVAIAEWANQKSWRSWLMAVTIVSLLLTVAALPATVWGVLIDLGILAWLAGARTRRPMEERG